MTKRISPIWMLNRIIERNYIPRYALSNFEREILIKYNYKRMTGRDLDLRNPKRFSEKIAWYMNFYDNDNFSNMLCKINVKQFVAKKIGEGHTAELYEAWSKASDVNFDKLPKSFVLKSNCSSFGNNIIFVDDKDSVDLNEIRERTSEWLDYKNTAINAFPRGYYHIQPKIMAEEIIGEARYQPVDYKIFCFNGIPTYSYSACEHFENGKAQSSKIAMYDMEWNQINVQYKNSQILSLPKPNHFEEMKQAAAVLSDGLPFVRVDFYDTDEKYYVGEMTFYSGGLSNSFTPDSFDFELGSKFILPPKQKYKRMKRIDFTND